MQSTVINFIGDNVELTARNTHEYMLSRGYNVCLVDKYPNVISQYKELKSRVSNVQYVITYSPIIDWIQKYNDEGESVNRLTMKLFKRFRNVNIILTGGLNYDSANTAIEILNSHDIPYRTISGYSVINITKYIIYEANK